MKRLSVFAIGISLLLLTAYHVAAQKSTKHHVVVEVNVEGSDAWVGALNNIENLQRAFAPAEVQVEAVSHGKGLGMLLKSNLALRERLEQLSARGVVFAACQNTMRKRNVTKDDLFPFVVTVDSGVAEVVRKQEAGWSYLKTGG